MTWRCCFYYRLCCLSFLNVTSMKNDSLGGKVLCFSLLFSSSGIPLNFNASLKKWKKKAHMSNVSKMMRNLLFLRIEWNAYRWRLWGLMWPPLIFELAVVQMSSGRNLLPGVFNTDSVPYTCPLIWFNSKPNMILIPTNVYFKAQKPQIWGNHQRNVSSGVKHIGTNTNMFCNLSFFLFFKF